MQACARTSFSLPMFTRAIAGVKSNWTWVHRAFFQRRRVLQGGPPQISGFRCARSIHRQAAKYPPSLFPRSDLTAANGRSRSRQVYVYQTVYKGKSAMAYRPILPVFKSLESGSLTLAREGCVFLEFAPAIGTQKYDWQKKQVFALSATEIGRLLVSDECEFYHDPNMGQSKQGQVNKRLTVRLSQDGSAIFFTLEVNNDIENVKEKIQIPLKRDEIAVMRAAFQYILPHLMGWHAIVDPSQAIIAPTTSGEGRGKLLSEKDENVHWE